MHQYDELRTEVRDVENRDYLISRYDAAIMFLPQRIRDQARTLLKEDRVSAEEIRLRTGHPASVLLHDGEISLGGEPVSRRDLDSLLDIATGASAHAARDSICSGYVTVRGGYRIGLCGSTITRDGQVCGFRTLSSAAVRISREIKGAAADIIEQIAPDKIFQSTLIVSPPGCGKTTLLRDMIRMISDGCDALGGRGLRVALADERNEVAAVYNGVPQMDIGLRTDVIDSCPKAAAVMMMMRAMNPQVIALDEITAPEDCDALIGASNCGVRLLATAHADSLDDLFRRPVYRRVAAAGLFQKVICIEKTEKRRNYSISEMEVPKC
jgi:stage III sporulation protein AA